MAKLIVSDLDVKDKKVLIRVDFNVPIKDGVIGDDNRIVAALPTIQYVIDHGGKAILLSHLGRVKTEEDKAKLTLKPVAERLSELLKKPVTFVPATRGKELEDAINKMNDGDVLVMENTRFEDLDGKKESGNDPELGKYWASLGDLFVNDAFGTAHRSHASNVGIASNMKQTAAGFLMEKEIKFLGDAVDNPKHPFIAILGGAKVSDKIGVIENLVPKADKILIGGGMTYTFYAAKGMSIGKSLVEKTRSNLPRRSWIRLATSCFCRLIPLLQLNSLTMPHIKLLTATFLMAIWPWISARRQSKNSKMLCKVPRPLFGMAQWVSLK